MEDLKKLTPENPEYWYSDHPFGIAWLSNLFCRNFQARLDKFFKVRSFYAGTPFNTTVYVYNPLGVKSLETYCYIDWRDEVNVYNQKEKLIKVVNNSAKNIFKAEVEFVDNEKQVFIRLKDPTVLK